VDQKSIGVALIGCGRIAGHHARAIRETNGLNLVAVSDLNLELANRYSSEFGVPAYANYRHMLRNHPEIEIVSVMTPSGMHFEHAMELVQDFRKSVVLEKPTVLKNSQLDKLYDAAESNGKKIFPVFQNRHNLAVQRVRQGLINEELGDLRTLAVRVRWCRPQRYYDLAAWRGTFALDGGALTNQGIHHIDLMGYLGGEIKRVVSKLSTLRAQIEVEDTAVAVVEFVSGALGTLEITTAAEPDDFEASISLVCSGGLAQIGGIAVNELQIYTPDSSACRESSEDFSLSVYGNGHEAIYKEISSCIDDRARYSVTQADVGVTLKLLNALYLSDELNSWVDISNDIESVRLGRNDDELAQMYRTPLE